MEAVQSYHASTAEPMENQEKIQERLRQLIGGSREGWTYASFWEFSCDYSGSFLGWGDEGRDEENVKMITSAVAEQESREQVLINSNILKMILDLHFSSSRSTPTRDYIYGEDDTKCLLSISITPCFDVDSGGLPIQAYRNDGPVWVSGADELCKTRCRYACRKRTCGLQTLVYIPLEKGVVELGSTNIIKPYWDLILKLLSLWEKKDDWNFWRRVHSISYSSLFLSDVSIGRKVEGLRKDKINEKKDRKLKSKVWDEFTKSKGEDGEILAICNHCGGEFDGSSKNGTTHLKKHLESMKCRATRNGATRNGGDGNGEKSTKIRDLASPVVIKERSYLLTMEMEEQNAKKERKRKSKVWDEFTWSQGEDGKQWAICNHCGREFDGSSKKGTTHLNDHLNTKRCQDKRIRGDGNGDKSTKTRDFASLVVIK